MLSKCTYRGSAEIAHSMLVSRKCSRHSFGLSMVIRGTQEIINEGDIAEEEEMELELTDAAIQTEMEAQFEDDE